jgi:DNA-directed RNA polymerase subunit F
VIIIKQLKVESLAKDCNFESRYNYRRKEKKEDGKYSASNLEKLRKMVKADPEEVARLKNELIKEQEDYDKGKRTDPLKNMKVMLPSQQKLKNLVEP